MKPLSSCFRLFMLHPVSLFIQMNVVYIYGMNRVIFVECQVAIFQLHRGKNKFDFQCQPHLTYYHILTYKTTTVFYSLMKYACLEAINTILIVFSLTWPGIEPLIYSTQDKQAIYYTTVAVMQDRTLDLQHSRQTSYLLHHCSSYVGQNH